MSVDLVEQLGSDNLIYGEVSGKKDFCYRSPGNTSVNLGDKLSLSIVDNKFYVFDKITNKRINWYYYKKLTYENLFTLKIIATKSILNKAPLHLLNIFK